MKHEIEIKHHQMGYKWKTKLCVVNPELKTVEEAEAIFRRWIEEFEGAEVSYVKHNGEHKLGITIPIRSRREFATIPVIIRRAVDIEYKVGIHHPNMLVYVFLNEAKEDFWDIDEFWKILALQQMYYREDENK